MSTSLKNLKKHHCYRERCLGDVRDYQNYLKDIKDQPPPKRRSKIKKPLTTHSQRSLHRSRSRHKHRQAISDRSQLEELRRRSEEATLRNCELSDQLQEKNRKIGQLKHKIKDCQSRLKGYEQKVLQLQSVISQNDPPKSGISHDRPFESHQQLRTLQNSQKALLEQMERYRSIERQYLQYRNQSQRKMERLVRENEQLRQLDSHDKDYDGEILQIRQQLNKLSLQHSPQPNTSTTDPESSTLKLSNRQLLIEREHLLTRIEQLTMREDELRGSLEAINGKVERWGEEYRQLVESSRAAEERCQYLQVRLQHKKEKHQEEKEEWAGIFKELVQEIDKLKREISRLQKSKEEIVHLYSSPSP